MENCVKLESVYKTVRLRRVKFTVSHFCDGSAGLKSSSFGYALHGGTRIDCGGVTLDIPEGSFFYLTAGVRYRSNWTGAPEIEYFMLHMESFQTPEQLYKPARIDPLSNQAALELLLQAEKGGPLALSRFYELLAMALPYLEKQSSTRSAAVETAVGFIHDHFAEDYAVSELANACCISESRLYHVFRKEMGVSPLEYRNEIRVERAAAMIRSGEYTLSEILRQTGFSSDIYFRKVFKKILGLTPTEYRRQTD